MGEAKTGNVPTVEELYSMAAGNLLRKPFTWFLPLSGLPEPDGGRDDPCDLRWFSISLLQGCDGVAGGIGEDAMFPLGPGLADQWE